MTYTVNYVLSPFKGNINGKDPQGIKLYLQTTKDIKKEADKLDISVSNAKYVVQIFLSLAKKYFCRRLAFMVETSAGDKNIFLSGREYSDCGYASPSIHILWTGSNW